MKSPDSHEESKESQRSSPQQEISPPAQTPTSTQGFTFPDVKTKLYTWLTRWFGVKWGRIILTILILLGMAWWQWEKIVTLPGVSYFLSRRAQASLPTADPKRFSVAVAHLEGDKNFQHEKFISNEGIFHTSGKVVNSSSGSNTRIANLARSSPFRERAPSTMSNAGDITGRLKPLERP